MTKQAKCTDVARLQEAIENIDGLALEGLSEIQAISSLAMSKLEKLRPGSPAPGYIDDIYWALHAIWEKAEQTESLTTHEAKDTGCAVMNTFTRRRLKEVMSHEKRA